MSFFALGLEKISIYNNSEGFLGLFNKAEVKIYSFVMADKQLNLPDAQKLLNSTSQEEKRKLTKQLAESVMGYWESITIEGIRDRHTIDFGDTGKIVYRSNKIPNSLDWFMLVIESDQDIRDFGTNLSEYLTNDRVDKITNAIVTAASTTLSPAAAAGVVLGKELLSAITFMMKKNKDDQLGVIEQSFIRPLHYPKGTRHGIGIKDVTGNMYYDYFIHGTDEV